MTTTMMMKMIILVSSIPVGLKTRFSIQKYVVETKVYVT